VAGYKIKIKPSAKKELFKLPKKELQKLTDKILSLSVNPRPAGVEKLSGDEKYRIRQGNYRIIYAIHDEQLIIIVVKIGHRRDVYRKF
jgi:mRNA interferase RelE/StbE